MRYSYIGTDSIYWHCQDPDGNDYYVPVNSYLDTSAKALMHAENPGHYRAFVTGATKTKLTYDTYGHVTAGADATTADIAASTDKNYVTDAQLVVIGNTSGVNTGDQDLSGYVPTTRTVNGHALSSNVTVTLADIGGAASGANTDITSVLLNQTGLVVKGGSSNALTIKPNETLSAARTLNLITGNSDRTITLTGDTSLTGTNTGDQTLGSLGAAASGANTDITSVLLNQTGLVVKGASSNALTIKPNETLSAGRTLNIITGDATRTVTLTGDTSLTGTNTGDQTLGSLGAAASGSNSDITALNSVLTLLKVAATGFKLQDTATKLLTIQNDNSLTGNRTLKIQVADADRTIALSGNLTVSAAATISNTNTGDQTLGSLGAAASGANTDITSVLLNQTGLVVKGASSNALTIKPNETLSAGRTLNIITGDADRTITLTGNPSLTGTNTGDQTITLTGNVTGAGTGSFPTTIAAGVVTEAMQVLADNTTANVSTSAHGYAPKAPNDTTKGLDGTGAYAKKWILVVKTADQSISSNASLATDNTLSFSMAASTKYIIRIRVWFTTGASGDFKYALTGPAGSTKIAIVRKHIDPTNLTTLVTTSEVAYTGSTSLAAGTGTTGGYIEFEMIVQNGLTTGTFGFQWAQGTSNGTNTTVHAGSYLEYTTAA